MMSGMLRSASAPSADVVSGAFSRKGFGSSHFISMRLGLGDAIEMQEAERRSAALNCAFWLKQDGFAGRSLWIWDRIPRARHFYST
jgi:hypothetical protein